ncbi:hypothetical protein BLOT_007805, partial [Blomia tropicalis]
GNYSKPRVMLCNENYLHTLSYNSILHLIPSIQSTIISGVKVFTFRDDVTPKTLSRLIQERIEPNGQRMILIDPDVKSSSQKLFTNGHFEH